MKVLVYFRASILASRGTPLRSRNLTAWLARRPGIEVLLLSRDPSPDTERLLGVRHRRIESAAAAPALLDRALAEWRPDVVYGQTHKGAFDLARLAAGQRPLRVADLHGDLGGEKLEDRQRSLGRRLKGFLSSRLHERRLHRLDGFTVVSEALLARVRRLGKPGLLLLGGVDTELFDAAPAAPADTLTVGYAGSFRSYHGLDDLVSAAARLVELGEPFRFLLIGDASQAPELSRRIERQLGERATLLPPVEQRRIPELLARCDVLVVPRRPGRAAEHNYPSKLSEYLAMNRPVVVTDVGQAGLLADVPGIALKVPAADPEALAAALLSLRDPERRARLASAGRAYAVEHLAWARIAARLDRFLRRLAAGAGQAPGPPPGRQDAPL